MKIFGGGDLEVVGAWHRQFDHFRAIERRRQMRDVGPQKGLQGIAPSRGVTKQLLEPALFRVGISAAIWLDSNLAPQRYRMDRRAALLDDTNHEDQRGHGRIAFRTRRLDLETELSRQRRIPRWHRTTHLSVSGRRSPLRTSCPQNAAGCLRFRRLST